MRELRRVALIGGDHAGSTGAILRGIHEFSHTDKPWLLRDFSRQQDELFQIDRAVEFGAEVIVANLYSSEVTERLAELKCPVLTWSYFSRDSPFPRVSVDDRAVGRMGAEYFLSRGYRHFGFARHEGWAFAEKRFEGFAQRIEEAGYEVSVMPRGESPARRQTKSALDFRMRWLRSLPKPVAVMAHLDSAARLICESAFQTDLRIPEDVAVLGVSNFEMICDLCWPPLSSVQTPDKKIGLELGRLIELALAGEPLPAVTRFLPLGVVERRSTDAFATHDPNLAAALRVMRERVTSGINVADVLREVPLSRGHLFRLFKAHLGHSPLEEIHRLRCEAAKQLLIRTDLAIPVVAKRTGFCSASHLSRIFKQVVGMTPIKFRHSR